MRAEIDLFTVLAFFCILPPDAIDETFSFFREPDVFYFRLPNVPQFLFN